MPLGYALLVEEAFCLCAIVAYDKVFVAVAVK